MTADDREYDSNSPQMWIVTARCSISPPDYRPADESLLTCPIPMRTPRRSSRSSRVPRPDLDGPPNAEWVE